jgi:hypothetical protein
VCNPTIWSRRLFLAEEQAWPWRRHSVWVAQKEGPQPELRETSALITMTYDVLGWQRLTQKQTSKCRRWADDGKKWLYVKIQFNRLLRIPEERRIGCHLIKLELGSQACLVPSFTPRSPFFFPQLDGRPRA